MILAHQNYPPLLLASQSPRRQQLLQEAGLIYRIQTAHTDENFPDNLPIHEVAAYVALQKAQAVLPYRQENEVIVAADTTVCLDNEIMGKPYDEYDAAWMLRSLSGKKHAVITGVCLTNADKTSVFSVSTQVYFKPLTHDQINYYVETYKPYDKAGGYAIQEWIGLVGIEKIEGCYFNVVGLPVSRLISELELFVPV